MLHLEVEIGDPERAKWVLLALGAAGGAPLTGVQVQKAVFLLTVRLGSDVLAKSPEFLAFAEGPMSLQLNEDVQLLANHSFIEIADAGIGDVQKFELTASGFDYCAEICADIPRESLEQVSRIVEWVRAQSFTSLVRTIHLEFPDYSGGIPFQPVVFN